MKTVWEDNNDPIKNLMYSLIANLLMVGEVYPVES